MDEWLVQRPCSIDNAIIAIYLEVITKLRAFSRPMFLTMRHMPRCLCVRQVIPKVLCCYT